MNVMIALPGDKYYAVPRKVLEKYAVTKKSFDKDVKAAWKEGETVFHSEVEGQSWWERHRVRTPTAVLGVRG